MNATKCQSCNTTVTRTESVERGNGHRVVSYHRVCWEKIHGPLVRVDTGRRVSA